MIFITFEPDRTYEPGDMIRLVRINEREPVPAVYLAHAIDHSNPDDSGLYEEVASQLVRHGACVYRPSTAWNLPEEPQAWVQEVNVAALEACKRTMVVWCKGQWSVGTPIELMQAVSRGNRVAWITDVGDTSWAATWLNERQPNLAIFNPDEIVEAVQWLLNSCDHRSQPASGSSISLRRYSEPSSRVESERWEASSI